MAEKGKAGAIITSVVLSIIITGGASYLLLPFVYPNMKGSFITEDNGIVVQSIYTEINTPCNITDGNLTYSKIPDTEASMTIRNNSRISVTFDVIFNMALDPSFSFAAIYNISIVVSGWGNKTYSILYYLDGAGGVARMVPIHFHATFITDPLPAGSYQVEVYWKSYVDQSGDNYLWLGRFYSESVTNPRSILLHELL